MRLAANTCVGADAGQPSSLPSLLAPEENEYSVSLLRNWGSLLHEQRDMLDNIRSYTYAGGQIHPPSDRRTAHYSPAPASFHTHKSTGGGPHISIFFLLTRRLRRRERGPKSYMGVRNQHPISSTQQICSSFSLFAMLPVPRSVQFYNTVTFSQ